MSKVAPLRRRYCVCGRACGEPALGRSNQTESGVHGAPNEPLLASPSEARAEKSTNAPSPPDALTLLQLKVRALEKYKSNYELLCSQLAELNTQVGLQLQRHEVDVTTLQSTISSLHSTNATLQHELQSTKHELQSLKTTSEKDREYAAGVHKQLATVADLLKAAEKRLREQEIDHQKEIQRHQSTQEHVNKLAAEKQKLENDISLLREQIVKTGDTDRLRRKYRIELKNLRHELDTVKEELEQQRALTRQTKKQVKTIRDERDVLTKQIDHFKADAMQFTAILDSQREEMVRLDKKSQRWRQSLEGCEAQLVERGKLLEDAESQLISIQEELVAKNARLEELSMSMKEIKLHQEQQQSELKSATLQIETLQAQLERAEREKEAYLKKVEQISTKKEDDQTVELQRRYHKELQQVKRLLSLNQQRTNESSQDMQVLKQELGSVQHLLRQCQRHRRRSDSEESGDERSWRIRHQRAEVEKAVLQSAIMEQVEEAW